MKKIQCSIVGASGYVGGELLRLLLKHPNVDVKQVTSERFAGQQIKFTHPNLRQYSTIFHSAKDLQKTDVLFLCLPHGETVKQIDYFMDKARIIIDLSADFRLNSQTDYDKWYGFQHTKPSLLKQKVFGLPEIYKEKIKNASLISCPGCMSTASILALYPLIKADIIKSNSPIFIEAKTGSSGSGSTVALSSLHAERSGAMRTFKPTNHRHTAEIQQELYLGNKTQQIFFTATAIEAVRGILVTCQLILKKNISESSIWKIYRNFMKGKPFLRLVKENKGIYHYPEPKLLMGTNVCEIGFEKDENSSRLVVMAAIDNLVKGSAGQAVQCLNINQGWLEITGLETVGFHPI